MAKKWVTEDELNYMKMGGKVVYAQEGMTAQPQGDEQQQQIMQLIQLYAKKAGISPEQLIQQLQQMQPEQAQQAIQQMVQELQSSQGFQKEPQYIQEEQEEMKKGGTVSPEKAKKILKDGTVHGKPLTEKQRKFFGAMASKKAEEGTLVNSLPPSLIAPIEQTKGRKNRGSTYEEFGGTVDLYNVNYQNAVQKMIQGGYMAEGGEAKPYFYNMTIPGPEVMGPGNPIFGKGLVFAKDGKNVKPYFYSMDIPGPEIMGPGNPIFGKGLVYAEHGEYVKPQFYDMTVGGPEVVGPGNPIFGVYAQQGANVVNYKIQKGDTLSQIAKMYNTTVSNLASINNIEDPNKIYAGKTLNIPVSSSPGSYIMNPEEFSRNLASIEKYSKPSQTSTASETKKATTTQQSKKVTPTTKTPTAQKKTSPPDKGVISKIYESVSDLVKDLSTPKKDTTNENKTKLGAFKLTPSNPEGRLVRMIENEFDSGKDRVYIDDKGTKKVYYVSKDDWDGTLKSATQYPILTGINDDPNYWKVFSKNINDFQFQDRYTPVTKSSVQFTNLYGYPGIYKKDATITKTIPALHSTYLGNPSENRPGRLESPTPIDNAISYGCSNGDWECIKKMMSTMNPATDSIITADSRLSVKENEKRWAENLAKVKQARQKKLHGGEAKPYFYNMNVEGPEVIGPGNPIFGVYTEEGGTIPPKGYHVMPSGKLMSNAEHKKNGSVGPKMKFTKGMLSIQGGQGAKLAKYGLNGMLSDGLTTPHDHYAQEGILVEDPAEIALRRAFEDNYNLKQNLGYQTDKFGFSQAIEENPILKRLMISSGMNFKTNPVRFNVSGQYTRNQDINTGNVNSSLMFPTKKGEVSFTGGYNRMPDKTNAYNTGVSYSGTTKRGGRLNFGVGVEGERNVPPRGNIDFSFEPFEEGGYITYRPKWGAAPYPTNRADYLAAFAEGGLGVTPWTASMESPKRMAKAGDNIYGYNTPAFDSSLQGFTQGFKNLDPNQMGYSFAGTSNKEPFLQPFKATESQKSTAPTDKLNLTTGTPASKTNQSYPNQIINNQQGLGFTMDSGLNKGAQELVAPNQEAAKNLNSTSFNWKTDKEISSGLSPDKKVADPLSMGLGVAGGAMDATAKLMASLGKEDSKAQAFGQGASNAMQIAGMATAPFKDIPVVGQALDVAGKTLGFLIGGPLAARKQAIENEEKKKQDKLRQYYERTQPGVYATQGQYMAKYGKNVNSMKQRVIDDIYSDFDKYMKLT